MNPLDFAYFALCSLLTLCGGAITVGARNPIRGAMGLLATILGIAGLYLMLSAETLAAVQVLVYAGAVVILFVFVIMILGPSATSPRDARSAIPRYVGAGFFLLAAVSALLFVLGAGGAALPKVAEAPAGFGSIEQIGQGLFGGDLVPFELSGALLLVAVVGAMAVARGKQTDPTLGAASVAKKKPAPALGAHGEVTR